jgi:molecular chaperone HtpG
MTALCEFLTAELGERVEKVAPGKRLVSSPAAVLAPAHGMSAQMRQMLQAMNPAEPLPAQKVELELNPRHGLVHALAAAREGNPELAKLAAAQLLDNALLAAGLLEDRVRLIDRGFRLMEAALKKSAE